MKNSVKHASLPARLAALLLAACLLVPVFSLAEDGEILIEDFTLTDQYGETHTLSEYRGKTVLVNFWATWCYYCVQEMPDLEAIYQETGKNQEDVIILGVAAPGTHDPDVNEAGIKSFLKEQGVTYPVLIDPKGKLFDKYVTEGYPTTLLIRPDGYLMYYIPGALDKENFQHAIKDTQEYTAPAKQE